MLPILPRKRIQTSNPTTRGLMPTSCLHERLTRVSPPVVKTGGLAAFPRHSHDLIKGHIAAARHIVDIQIVVVIFVVRVRVQWITGVEEEVS